MKDTSQNLLALTRPRAGLIILGSPAKVQAEYAADKHYTNQAYYKILKWCKNNKVFINFEREGRKAQTSIATAPYDVSTVTEHVYRPHNENNTPFSFCVDPVFNLRFPDFANMATAQEDDAEEGVGGDEDAAKGDKDGHRWDDNREADGVGNGDEWGGIREVVVHDDNNLYDY
jgi:hypothetical protein